MRRKRRRRRRRRRKRRRKRGGEGGGGGERQGEHSVLGLESPEVHARILIAFDALENSEDKHPGRNTGHRCH